MIAEHLRAAALRLPKVELHRHLEGSVRLSTLVEFAQKAGMHPDYQSAGTLRPLVQCVPGEPRTSQHFLTKFRTLRHFFIDANSIGRITREAVEDAAADAVCYMELRFTPRALSAVSGIALADVVPLVCDAANEAAERSGIIVRYIVSMNRHESAEVGEWTLNAALAHRDRGVVGLDLAGDERNYPAAPFHALFQRARDAGLGITIHAGEWAGPASVWDALRECSPDRIGHGLRALEDVNLLELLVERQIPLELCPTSNYLSGVVPSVAAHPLSLLTSAGVFTTLNSDDPCICDVTLSDEVAQLMDAGQADQHDVEALMLRGAQAAFLPPAERVHLQQRLEQLFATH